MFSNSCDSKALLTTPKEEYDSKFTNYAPDATLHCREKDAPASTHDATNAVYHKG